MPSRLGESILLFPPPSLVLPALGKVSKFPIQETGTLPSAYLSTCLTRSLSSLDIVFPIETTARFESLFPLPDP